MRKENQEIQARLEELNVPFSLFYRHLLVFLSTPLYLIITSFEITNPYLFGILWLVGLAWIMMSYNQISTDYVKLDYQLRYGLAKKENAIDIMNIVAEDVSTEKRNQLAITFLLGAFAAVGIALQDNFLYQLGLFMISLSIYHFLEYWFVLLYHFKDVSVDSFLINQGKFYTIAMWISFTEYFVELLMFPNVKDNFLTQYLVLIGCILAIFGHYFRAGAEFTAKSNFTHQISYSKKNSHKLVTHGVYSFSRHPGYFGWYIWSVSTQIMIMNPVWVVGFYFASYYFFKDRIEDEEELLIEFFGYDYIRYREKVPTRIPFIQ